MKILYVLPVKGGSGGAHSVAQEVNELIKFGVDVSIAVDAKNAPLFHTNYVDLKNISNAIESYDGPVDLAKLLVNVDLVVCTIFTSTKIVEEALTHVVGKSPKVGYYVQDYEPLFLHSDDPLRDDAVKSYTRFKEALLFAKTDWIRDVVTKNHNVAVHKVSPSLDGSIYYPSIRAKRRQFWISAMVRPHTKRRAPRRTMNVLKNLHALYGDRVNISIFGCNTEELVANNLPTDFEFTNHGVLRREQVGSLFRSTDLFLDLSDYQAFGRTGLEAMACGCSTVLPGFGGSHEYARHGVNSFLVDTRSQDSILNVIMRLVEMDGREFESLQKEAINTSQGYSVSKAAYSKYVLFESYIEA